MAWNIIMPLPVLALSSSAVAACSSDDRTGASPNGAMLAALGIVDSVDFQTIDKELIRPERTIDDQWLGQSHRRQIAAEAMKPPDELEPQVLAFMKATNSLVLMLNGTEACRGAAPAKEALQSKHDSGAVAWPVIARPSGFPVPDGEKSPASSAAQPRRS